MCQDMELYYPRGVYCDVDYPEDETTNRLTPYEQRAKDINLEVERLWSTNLGHCQYNHEELLSFLRKSGCTTDGNFDQLIQRLHSYLCTGVKKT